MSIASNLESIRAELPSHVELVAVSKTKPVADLKEAYDAGQRIFGENKIQEMASKHEELPKDIAWHMIGHVQTNKVKYMAPFVALVHGVDREKVLKELNKQALKNERTIPCLLQVHIAVEESKFGFSAEELRSQFQVFRNTYSHVDIQGLMGMASNTKDEEQVASEFKGLHDLYTELNDQGAGLSILSMGMSGDYKLAIENGSNMIRVGSSIFGARDYASKP